MRKISIVANILILIFLFSSFSCSTDLDNGPQDKPQNVPTLDSIKIASFNIQIFGQSKSSKQEVMDILVQIIRDFDIVAIQEIRDAAGTAIITLKNQVNADGSSYDVIVGPRVGRSISKEQYEQAEWVAYQLTIEEVNGQYERSNNLGTTMLSGRKYKKFVKIII